MLEHCFRYGGLGEERGRGGEGRGAEGRRGRGGEWRGREGNREKERDGRGVEGRRKERGGEGEGRVGLNGD